MYFDCLAVSIYLHIYLFICLFISDKGLLDQSEFDRALAKTFEFNQDFLEQCKLEDSKQEETQLEAFDSNGDKRLSLSEFKQVVTTLINLTNMPILITLIVRGSNTFDPC